MKIIIAVAVMLISGCTSVRYPAEWKPVDTANSSESCIPITGRFSQRGTARTVQGPFWNRADGQVLTAFSRVLGLDITPHDAVTHLTLNISDQHPGVTLWVNREKLLTRNFQPDELKCVSGHWRLELDWSLWRSSGILLDTGAILTSLLVQQTTDGAVVVSKTRKMVGTALLLPVYFKEQDWHQFTRITDSVQQNAPNAPHGVLSPDRHFSRLLPPPTQTERQENPKLQVRCLNTAIEQYKLSGTNLSKDEESRLAGRSTQAFLSQQTKTTKAYTNTEFIDRVIGQTPTTKHALLLKPHWLDPSISDRYVLCLLDAGYIWEDVTRTETNR
jgi:hypothetical protein